MTNNPAQRYSRKNVAELNGIARLAQRTHTNTHTHTHSWADSTNTNTNTHTHTHTPQTTEAHFLILPRDHHPHDSRGTGSNPDGGL